MLWRRRNVRRDLELTDRQAQVLELVARGYTNPQIADALDISLDGAKWHVREIISKLGVSSREEAAEQWRSSNAVGVRVSRTVGGLVAGFPLKWVAGAVGVAVITVGAVAVVLAAGDSSGSDPDAGDTPSASATSDSATASPVPATAITDSTPVPAPTVAGLFEEPQALPVPARELAPPGREFPQSGLPPTFVWDGSSTMVYDRQTGTVMSLGQGAPGAFSPSGEWMAWMSGELSSGVIRAINLATGEQKDLGPGRSASVFLDDRHLLVDTIGTEGDLVDVITGKREPVSDRAALFQQVTDFFQISVQHGPRPLARVSDQAGTRALEFEASRVVQIGTDELLVATLPRDGVVNIFTVAFSTGRATFITTSRASERFSLGGNATHIAWNPDVCADPGEAWVFDRGTGEFTHVPKGLMVSQASRAPDGLLGTGATGLERILDPETMAYVFISPAPYPQWSADYRYVSVGTVGGHGSICLP